MLLGDIIARFRDEVVVSETLLSLDDPALTAHVIARAAEKDLTASELAMELVGQFVTGATEEDWLTLIGQMSRSENPGGMFLRRVLST